MMTLLLRLQGPLQAWGTQSRFEHRDTGREPSKSGVIGLLCAALGRPRHAPVDDLAALRMGVRVDREGLIIREYQTAGGGLWRGQRYGVAKADGARGDPVVSRRFFLADASFLVGLEGDGPEQEALLRLLDQSLAAPRWPLFLGRKGCVPAVPPRLPEEPPYGPGLRVGALREVLLRYPWPEQGGQPVREVRLVLEEPLGTRGDIRRDVPVSFAPEDRRYRERTVRTEFVPAPHSPINTLEG
ncbi:type I-E CRISPR-associated protein Cas5/CasD [Kallotenue papyrolyticum]|uniref:type I-E CRISPR-associated protein Cas5/CasD n=1 Tax=Kallotenue papyrolyticum TaxID=1325125 RepID=UPI00046EE0BA|nr:type I-E CRISPR-associated protein Cas5/CasD [Kallotenue papyrolyticum]